MGRKAGRHLQWFVLPWLTSEVLLSNSRLRGPQLIVRIDRDQIRLHAAWGLLATISLLVVAGWYFVAASHTDRWPGGGSLPGLFAGILAAGIIVFEMMLWPRKQLRRLRLFPAKYWMAAHIWFGLICLPLAICHSGFHWGGYLPTILLILLGLTVVSGIYGLIAQNILPSWMLRHLPAETIHSQIDHVAELAAGDARRLVVAACGPDPAEVAGQNVDDDRESVEANVQGQAVVVGAVREVGRAHGRSLQTQTVYSHRDDAAILWNAFHEIEPFLLHGKKAGGPISTTIDAGRWFERLRRGCHESSHGVIDTLQGLCDQRHQFDVQQRVHLWLHGWIPLHVALSVALTVLLLAHVWTALKYW